MSQTDLKMATSLRERICIAMQEAEDADRCSVRAQTLRLVKCAMTDRDVKARGRGACEGCEDDDIQALLETMVAQRTLSVQKYDEAGRIEDAEREREEIEILNAFLPRPLAGEALNLAVKAVVGELGATKLKDVGRCMSALRERFPGQIDPASASKAVRAAIG